MAEFIARDVFSSYIAFQSAGSIPGYVDPFMPFVMQERNIDFSDHISKSIDEIELPKTDLIITLTPQAHHHILEEIRGMPVDVEYWPTQNPSQIAGNREQILEMYRKVRDTLEEKIKNRFELG